MESEGVSLPIHHHVMMPWNDLRKGDCCGGYEAISDGYYCKSCDFFVHKKCGDETFEYIEHPSHSEHTLRLQSRTTYWCDLCGKFSLTNHFYSCYRCDFDMDLQCTKYPPPEVIDNSEKHNHRLTLHKERLDQNFSCAAKCGMDGIGWFYKCHECDSYFHIDCVWYRKGLPEVNHSYHSLHPLKLLRYRERPDYCDGKCRLCGKKITDKFFYHCSSCNFTLDLRCVLHPPPHTLLDLKAHDHHLTLLPRLDSFTCNACGLKGDRSPYVCFQCGFTIHQDFLGLPRVININRHDHRVSHTSVLGVVNSVCGVCRQKVDWKYGGYSCHKCPSYVVHSKCATRKDVWNGKELEGVPEETEETKPYVVIDEKTIHHFIHEEHYLRLNANDVQWEENKRCNACTQPIALQSFYGCIMGCDFILHKNCAEFPKKKRHFLHNDRLTLVTSDDKSISCDACERLCNGFKYKDWNKEIDVQ